MRPFAVALEGIGRYACLRLIERHDDGLEDRSDATVNPRRPARDIKLSRTTLSTVVPSAAASSWASCSSLGSSITMLIGGS
jgi:hypothetical protein